MKRSLQKEDIDPYLPVEVRVGAEMASPLISCSSLQTKWWEGEMKGNTDDIDC